MKSLVQMDSPQSSSANCKRQVNRGVLDLPHEMISDIFCRLPTESIMICRVVCKTWDAITKDPCFIDTLGKSHYQPTRLLLKPLPIKENRHTPKSLVLIDMEKHKTRHISLEKMFEDLQIMCSCNGFLCMAHPTKLDPVVIYNPITRDRSILPVLKAKKYLLLHQVVGLGFDASTNKYKVVRAYTAGTLRRKLRRFEIISLGESSWRELRAPKRIANRDGCGVLFLNGALYWTMSKGTSNIIVHFDLSDEKFRRISFPRHISSRHVSLGLMDVSGTVTLVKGDRRSIRFWKVGDGEGDDELSFNFYSLYDTHVKWGDELTCAFVCQMSEESYLLQVGYCNSQNEHQEHLTQYFPDKVHFLDLKLQGLPASFTTLCFKPSIVPVPK